jgi:predicted Fe-Mo cluster-binding NifX family protein
VPGIRVAVPTDGAGGECAVMSKRLARADSFTLFDVEGGEVAGVRTVRNFGHGPDGCHVAAGLLTALGVAVVVAPADCPVAECSAQGFDVCLVDASVTPRAAVQACLVERRIPQETPPPAQT